MLHRVWIGVAFLGMICVPVAYPEPPIIRIGLLTTLSGELGLAGQSVQKGVQMHVEELNKAGGVLGARVELVVRDTEGRPEKARDVFRELVQREKIGLVIGPVTSAEGLALAQEAEQSRTLFISPLANTSASLGRNGFSVAASSTYEGRAAAELMERWKVRQIAIVGTDLPIAREVARFFTNRVAGRIGEARIVDEQWVKPGDMEIEGVVSKQMSRRPDAVLVVLSLPQLVAFGRSAGSSVHYRSIQSRVLVGGQLGAPEITRAYGEQFPVGMWANASYVLFRDGCSNPQCRNVVDALKVFTAKARQATGGEYPTGSLVQGYLAARVLFAAVAEARTPDPERIAAKLAGLTVEATPVGRLTIDRDTHRANRGLFFGPIVRVPEFPFPIMDPPEYIYPDSLK
jgi:branched-chain amino acid transport system substrate-binding protein